MDARQFLYNVRNEWKESVILKERVNALAASLLPAGIRYDKDKVQTTPSDQISKKMAALADYERELEERQIALMDHHRQAQRMIAELDDTRERQVLELYFLSVPPLTMSMTADRIGYSRDHTYKLFARGLAKMTKEMT